MELNSEVVTEAPKPSATVVLLRDDRGRGLEVFLLRRHTASAGSGRRVRAQRIATRAVAMVALDHAQATLGDQSAF